MKAMDIMPSQSQLEYFILYALLSNGFNKDRSISTLHKGCHQMGAQDKVLTDLSGGDHPLTII